MDPSWDIYNMIWSIQMGNWCHFTALVFSPGLPVWWSSRLKFSDSHRLPFGGSTWLFVEPWFPQRITRIRIIKPEPEPGSSQSWDAISTSSGFCLARWGFKKLFKGQEDRVASKTPNTSRMVIFVGKMKKKLTHFPSWCLQYCLPIVDWSNPHQSRGIYSRLQHSPRNENLCFDGKFHQRLTFSSQFFLWMITIRLHLPRIGWWRECLLETRG